MTTDPRSKAWRREPADQHQRRQDGFAALGLFGAGVLSMLLVRAMGLLVDPASPALSIGLLAVATLPLAARRIAPVPVLGVVAATMIAMGELNVPEVTVINIALFTALYTVGAWDVNRARAGLARAAVVGVLGVWLLITLFRASTVELGFDGPGLGALTPFVAFGLQQVLVNVIYFAGAWWFGDHAWASARQRALTALRTEQLGEEQDKLARQALTIERLRIARELHDAVAHHVSLMGVQAAAARTVLATDPALAGERLETLEESSRVAVSELYQLLGTLRDDEAEPSEPTVSLGLGSLDGLVADARSAGLRASFEQVGEPCPVPPLVELNLYRIAQEALTNVRKHAGAGTRVTVHLRYGAGAVELEVADDGRGRPGPPPRGAGLGLVGMRERAASLGGRLEVVRRERSGWIVRVTVPVDAAVGSPA